MVAWLQKVAGNEAVAELLGTESQTSGISSVWLQRQTPTPQPPVLSTDERLAAAAATVKEGRLDDAIWKIFRERNGSADQIRDSVWAEDLALADVQLATPAKGTGAVKKVDPATKLKATVKAKVEQVVRARLQALIKQAKSKDEATRLADQISRIAGAGLGWDTAEVANVLWREWVGPARIANGAAGGGLAKALYDSLVAAAAKHVPKVRQDAFGSAVVSALDAGEIAAVETVLRPRAQWVRDEAGYAGLTDEVHRARGGSGRRDDPKWQELKGRMPRLVVVAEANIVNAMRIANRAVTPDVWAQFRGRFIATISKTIWRYHDEDIVDASVFGTAVVKSKIGQGLHRDVAQAVRLVEQSALRLSGFSSIAELRSAAGSKGQDKGAMKNPITMPGTEFRFEPMSHPDWMQAHAVLSPHGTGRAIDFRGATNPSVGGAAYEVLRLLSGPVAEEQALDKSNFDWVSARKQAEALAPLMHQRAGLEGRLATETNLDVRNQLQTDIARVTDELGQQPQKSPVAETMRKNAEQALDRMAKIETAFQAAWQPFAAKSDNKELLAALLANADAAKADAEKQLAALVAAEAKAQAAKANAAAGVPGSGAGSAASPGPAPAGGAASPSSSAPVSAPSSSPAPSSATGSAKAPRKGSKPAAPPKKSAEVTALETSIARIDKLRPFLVASGKKGDPSGAQNEMLKTLRGAGEHGLTDMPLWLVQAFLEQGWTWGGSWGGFLDAMHFDYLGPVADVIG